tara:strand:- start:9047 stop:10153 length:1107 start_codon:yes stop_codon:yes gene_type:complete
MKITTLMLAPKVMKVATIAITLAITLLTPTYSTATETIQPPTEITFLTWGEYISKDIVDKFEAEYNAKIHFVYFESDNARNEMLTTSGTDGYDLMLIDSVNLSLYQKLNWITPFDISSAPNINNVKLPTLSDLGKQDNTCAAYSWGTTGIAYRKDLVSEPITSWKQIFNPAPELNGKMLMSTMPQEMIGMALKTLGYSMNSSNKQELEEARQLLLSQAPSVAGYSAVATESKKSKLVLGEVSVALTYNSDALMLKELNPEIEYVLPKEGGAIWADFVCLSAKANNPKLAHQFINFINSPEQAAQNALFIFAATPNTEAEKLLPAEFLNNPIIYPNKAAVALSEKYEIQSIRTIKKQNAIMNELRMTLQ